jgi:hypothetical protein
MQHECRNHAINGGPENEGFVFTGSEGTLQIEGGAVSVTRAPHQEAPDFNIDSWANSTQERFLSGFYKKYPATHPGGEPEPKQESYQAPTDYSDSYDHLTNFFDAVPTRRPVVEDPVFGFRAAGAALLANVSYERKGVVMWNPDEMKFV